MPPRLPSIKRSKIDLYEEFNVAIGDGDSRRTMNVAKEYLTKSSAYLRTACSREWKEGQTKSIVLTDVNPAAFATYVQWLQTGQLVLVEEETPSKDADKMVRKMHFKAITSQVIDLYILADYLADTAVRNLVIDEWRTASKALLYGPNAFEIQRAYSGTASGSPLRRMFVDYCVAESKPEWFVACSTKLPHAFLLELAAEWARLRVSKEVPKPLCLRDKCAYHDHDEDCPKCA